MTLVHTFRDGRNAKIGNHQKNSMLQELLFFFSIKIKKKNVRKLRMEENADKMGILCLRSAPSAARLFAWININIVYARQ